MVRKGRHGLADQRGEEEQHDVLQAPKILAGDILVDADFHQIRLRHAEGLLQRQQQHGEIKQPLVGNDKFPQAPDQAQIVGFAEDFFLLRGLGH